MFFFFLVLAAYTVTCTFVVITSPFLALGCTCALGGGERGAGVGIVVVIVFIVVVVGIVITSVSVSSLAGFDTLGDGPVGPAPVVAAGGVPGGKGLLADVDCSVGFWVFELKGGKKCTRGVKKKGEGLYC